MNEQHEDDRVSDSGIERYVLGLASPDERLAIEREYFADDRQFERVKAVEDDLFYDYVQGALPPDQRSAFEAQFLQRPGGQDRLDLARAVLAELQRPAMAGAMRRVVGWDRPAMRRVWLLAASLVFAAGAAWLARDFARARRPADIIASSGPRAASPSPSPSPTTAPMVVSLTLVAATTRSAGSVPDLRLPPGASAVRLVLPVGAAPPASQYRITIRTADGTQVWAGVIPPPSGPEATRLVIEVPSAVLTPGDYETVVQDSSSADTLDALSFVFRILQP